MYVMDWEELLWSKKRTSFTLHEYLHGLLAELILTSLYSLSWSVYAVDIIFFRIHIQLQSGWFYIWQNYFQAIPQMTYICVVSFATMTIKTHCLYFYNGFSDLWKPLQMKFQSKLVSLLCNSNCQTAPKLFWKYIFVEIVGPIVMVCHWHQCEKHLYKIVNKLGKKTPGS